MDEILLKMKEEVENFTEHYKSDFYDYDINSYGRMYPSTHFIFIVRKHGTYICGVPQQMKEIKDRKKERIEASRKLISYYSSVNKGVKFFYVIKGKSIRELKKHEIDEIENFKESEN